MAQRPATISDVARRAGVSESTVSRCLTGTNTAIRISERTRQCVLQAVRDLGYQPNPAARALRGKSTKLLGLIVPEINDCFFAQMIEVISDVAGRQGYELALGYAHRDPEEALLLSDVLDLRRCDGLLLLGDLDESEEDPSFLTNLREKHRVVSVCRGGTCLVQNTASVGVDNARGIRIALDHLVELGHERIGLIGARRIGDIQERYNAFHAFMDTTFEMLPDEYVVFSENSYHGGYEAMQELLSLEDCPTAIVALTDTMAIGALKAAAEAEIAIPAHLSLIGFDDIEISGYVTPALTTVRQPISEIGERAVELTMDLMASESAPEEIPHYLVEPMLVVRDSCGPPQASSMARDTDRHLATRLE